MVVDEIAKSLADSRDEQLLRHRVLQCDGRRYSLKLEPAFWSSLEAAAKHRHMRLAQLVREVASRGDADSSLTAKLRQFCLGDLQSRAKQLEDEIATQSPNSDSRDLAIVIASFPLPCVVVSSSARMTQANNAFLKWRNARRGDFFGKPFDHFFQLRLPAPLLTLVQEAINGGKRHFPAKVAFVAPGRIVVSNATVCLFALHSITNFAYLVTVETDLRS